MVMKKEGANNFGSLTYLEANLGLKSSSSSGPATQPHVFLSLTHRLLWPPVNTLTFETWKEKCFEIKLAQTAVRQPSSGGRNKEGHSFQAVFVITRSSYHSGPSLSLTPQTNSRGLGMHIGHFVALACWGVGSPPAKNRMWLGLLSRAPGPFLSSFPIKPLCSSWQKHSGEVSAN